MSNVGAEGFSYDSFKMAYDSDEVIKALTHRFDQNGVELKTKNTSNDRDEKVDPGKAKVSQMAKRATNIARSRS